MNDQQIETRAKELYKQYVTSDAWDKEQEHLRVYFRNMARQQLEREEKYVPLEPPTDIGWGEPTYSPPEPLTVVAEQLIIDEASNLSEAIKPVFDAEEAERLREIVRPRRRRGGAG